ncbi:MAG: pyridoxamine 5'-phosphate oxidase family protein [Sulfuricurvum sp.]|uniref:HugZ family pyridoxamine 5'-phosphate oxidase n=1 Tax=Sulfuricurvum sp. TaxID=2025608 RepID=UPI0026192A60|nr:pyridoxamine 5'-phosphate oxidase family protein [Sulfuricurvum sp.]MDD2829776.1 pyridoxamine 5'-phosphate oxidase family protein [Sulfuricurvum sp.]MDD4948430.1 pyridoxamine 5'-phosphate oxidase family protein [Sulfuricurvum sp.]
MTTQEVELFLETFQTLIMASLTPDGAPHASTAPYVRVGNDFYILISTVAQHGRNLLSNPNVSLLFVEDESQCTQPFARKRITIEAIASEMSRENDVYISVIESLKARFDAELVTSLTQMGDFHLFKLSPKSGSVVMGFGKAYRLNENLEVLTQIIAQHQRGHGNG